MGRRAVKDGRRRRGKKGQGKGGKRVDSVKMGGWDGDNERIEGGKDERGETKVEEG